MQPTQVTTWITEARFAPYLEEAGGEHEKALALYVWNARISAAVFETLHHVEVILRNAVDAQFAPLEDRAAPHDTWLENPEVLNDASRQRYMRRSAGSRGKARRRPGIGSWPASRSDSGGLCSTRSTPSSPSRDDHQATDRNPPRGDAGPGGDDRFHSKSLGRRGLAGGRDPRHSTVEPGGAVGSSLRRL